MPGSLKTYMLGPWMMITRICIIMQSLPLIWAAAAWASLRLTLPANFSARTNWAKTFLGPCDTFGCDSSLIAGHRKEEALDQLLLPEHILEGGIPDLPIWLPQSPQCSLLSPDRMPKLVNGWFVEFLYPGVIAPE